MSKFKVPEIDKHDIRETRDNIVKALEAITEKVQDEITYSEDYAMDYPAAHKLGTKAFNKQVISFIKLLSDLNVGVDNLINVYEDAF